MIPTSRPVNGRLLLASGVATVSTAATGADSAVAPRTADSGLLVSWAGLLPWSPELPPWSCCPATPPYASCVGLIASAALGRASVKQATAIITAVLNFIVRCSPRFRRRLEKDRGMFGQASETSVQKLKFSEIEPIEARQVRRTMSGIR